MTTEPNASEMSLKAGLANAESGIAIWTVRVNRAKAELDAAQAELDKFTKAKQQLEQDIAKFTAAPTLTAKATLT